MILIDICDEVFLENTEWFYREALLFNILKFLRWLYAHEPCIYGDPFNGNRLYIMIWFGSVVLLGYDSRLVSIIFYKLLMVSWSRWLVSKQYWFMIGYCLSVLSLISDIVAEGWLVFSEHVYLIYIHWLDFFRDLVGIHGLA